LLSATADRSRQEAQVVEAVLERRVRALLLVPVSQDHSYLEGERQLGTPIVAVDRPLIDALSDSVVFANREGARNGTRALLDAGHRRIAFVGSRPTLYTHGERLSGYRDALVERGITPDPALERTDAPDIDSAARSTISLLQLSEPPQAIVAGNNRAAIGVLETLRAQHASPGLIAFDDFELARTLGISVVAHDDLEMGRTAASIAIARLRGESGPSRQVVLPTRPILRMSHLKEGLQ
jgi:LacI family transcriptional regulator